MICTSIYIYDGAIDYIAKIYLNHFNLNMEN